MEWSQSFLCLASFTFHFVSNKQQFQDHHFFLVSISTSPTFTVSSLRAAAPKKLRKQVSTRQRQFLMACYFLVYQSVIFADFAWITNRQQLLALCGQTEFHRPTLWDIALALCSQLILQCCTRALLTLCDPWMTCCIFLMRFFCVFFSLTT